MIQPQLATQPGGIFFLTGGYNDEDAIEGLPLLGADGHTLCRGLRACGLTFTDRLPDSFMRTRRREVARLVWERRAHSFLAIDDGSIVGGISGRCSHSLSDRLPGLPGLGKLGYPTGEEWFTIFARVRAALLAVRPNIVVCLGDLPLWLLTGQTSTDEWRGAVRLVGPSAPITMRATPDEATILRFLKVLPTFHPSRIHQEYRRMVPFTSDLGVVKDEAEYPEIHSLAVAVWLEPNLSDLQEFERQHLFRSTLITVDIETARGQITSIQFGASPTTAITVPFVDYRRPSRSYWPTVEEELAALDWCERILASSTPKLMQFGTYDTTYLCDRYDLNLRGYRHDLRLVQHVLSPEEPKSLAYMGSMHTQMPAWKSGESKGHAHSGPAPEEKRDG
jgi:uracil-DNA glycosylase